MKILFLSLFLLSILFSKVNKEILLIESKIYPKIMMLIKNLEDKNKIQVAIVSNHDTINSAEILKKLIRSSKLQVNIINKVNLHYDVYITSYLIKKEQIDGLISHGKILFSISPNYINNTMFSIYIGPKVYAYINPYLIKKGNIKINPIIFKVGKIYE